MEEEDEWNRVAASDSWSRIEALQKANQQLCERIEEYQAVLRFLARGWFAVEARANTTNDQNRIEDWCKASIKEAYRVVRDNAHLTVIFSDKAEAALFKMFWYG